MGGRAKFRDCEEVREVLISSWSSSKAEASGRERLYFEMIASMAK
jgi:hypothetical protein